MLAKKPSLEVLKLAVMNIVLVAGAQAPISHIQYFHVSSDVSLVLSIPEGWEARQEATGSRIDLSAPNGQNVVLEVMPLWHADSSRSPMSSEEVVHLDTVRTSSVLANARKGTAKSRIISGERSDVTVWSFSEDAPDGKVSYVTDATVMVSGPPNVLVGMTTRSFGRDDKLTQVVLQLLGNADIETKYPAYPSSLSAEATRRVGLLLQRVDTYHLLLAKGKYRDAINIWSDEYTSDTDVVERNINEMKRWGKRGSPSSWEIVDVWLMEDYARVHLVLSGNQEGQGQSSDKTREFWVYDGSLWYVIPKQLPAWEESRAIRVPLAEVR